MGYFNISRYILGQTGNVSEIVNFSRRYPEQDWDLEFPGKELW